LDSFFFAFFFLTAFQNLSHLKRKRLTYIRAIRIFRVQLTLNIMLRSLQNLIFSLLFFLISSDTNAQWQACQGLDGGPTGSIIAYDSTLLVSGLGVYRTDLTHPWEKSFPHNSSGNLLKAGPCLFSHGNHNFILRSFDQGITWSEPPANFITNTMCLIDTVLFWGGWMSVYRSDDYMESCELITNLPQLDSPLAFSADSLVFIIDEHLQKAYQSIDLGDNWDSITYVGLPGLPDFEIIDMAIHNNTIWLCGVYGIYYLNNERTEWISFFDTSSNYLVFRLFESNGTLFAATEKLGVIEIDEYGTSWSVFADIPFGVHDIINFEDGYYCATVNGPVYIEADGTWQSNFAGINDRDISSIEIVNDSVLVCANEELFISENAGESFSKKDEINAYQIIAFNTYFYLADYQNILVSYNNMSSWDTISGPWEHKIYRLSVSDNYLFVSTNEGLFRSKADSISWEQLEISLDCYCYHCAETIDSVVVFINTKKDSAYISWDYGNHFEFLLETHDGMMGVYKSDRSFFILDGDAILYSEDIGKSWMEIENCPANIKSIERGGDAMVTGALDYDLGELLYFSDDMGKSWTDISDNLPYIFYKGFKHLKIHDQRILVASGSQGLWYRDDILTGTHQEKFTEPNTFIVTIYPNPVGSTLNLSIKTNAKSYDYKIFDVQGRTKFQATKQKTQVPINLKCLEPGVYFFEIKIEGNIYVEKILKR
jgi:Secretion system C-terminal sorting domain